jgi:photosynthetic reaction center cytochrome c subunit
MRRARSWGRFSCALVVVSFVVLALLWNPDGLVARSSGSQAGAGRHITARGLHAEGVSSPAQETTKVPTAGDAYMNVQVLKDIPSDQLIPSMKYISQALGVRCDFCHDPKSFESDDKPQKDTARNMMKMMFAINKDNFNGRREVTCYTCHRGVSRAANMPTLSAAAVTAGAGAAIPPENGGPSAQPSVAGSSATSPAAPAVTVDEIVAKYTDALGGAAAVQKITTLDEKGTIELPFNGSIKAQAEEMRKAPDKAVVVVHLPNGAEFAQGFNGTAGWQEQPGHGVDDLKGDDLVRAKDEAAFIPGLNLKQGFSRAQVAAVDKIGDHGAYRVIAWRTGGGQVRFYFDTQSGLLLRVSERIESPLGALPQDTDYSDYRDVSGVKVPFTVTEARVEGPTTFKWEQIQANVAVEDARFDKPAQKAAQP